MSSHEAIVKELVRVRESMLIVNIMIAAKMFKIPIHLAFGHEAIAVGMSSIMTDSDKLCLTHRNIHYNIARSDNFCAELDEYMLMPSGLHQGRLGAMNFTNAKRGVIYTSSILANCLPVATGVAMAEKVKSSQGLVSSTQDKGITVAVTGDGALEEGAFYESLMMACALKLPILFLVENNEWSMHTRIDERRAPIDLEAMAKAFSIPYRKLSGNDVVAYRDTLSNVRQDILVTNTPHIVEVELVTLGYVILKDDRTPEGRYINYHQGHAPNLDKELLPIIETRESDPLFVARQKIGAVSFEGLVRDVQAHLPTMT